MFLTCDKCQTVWRLDEKHLALGGRVVRCTSCGNTWFEQQVTVPGVTPDPQEATAADASFSDVLIEQMDDGASRAVAPLDADTAMPAYDYHPAGLGPNAFGAAVFALLFFVTISAVLLFKGPITAHAPSMTRLYEAVGVHLRAPGEGLSLSGLLAQTAGDTLTMSGKVGNVSKDALPYPSFRVTLRGADGVFLKDWSIYSRPATLAPGETVPLELNFKDIPAGGQTVEVKVLGS